MQEAAVVSQWGNSKGIRMPVEVLRRAQIDLNDGEPVGNEQW